jgi:hypothetical protein
VGLGIGGLLVLAIMEALLFARGPSPERQTLKDLSGNLVEVRMVNRGSGDVVAEVVIERDKAPTVLFQHNMKHLKAKVETLRAGDLIVASVSEKSYGTGGIRRPMWELAANGRRILSYEEIAAAQGARSSDERSIGLAAGMFGVLCLAIFGIRRVFRAKTPNS